MQALRCANRNEPQVPVLNVRISSEMLPPLRDATRKDNQRVPKKDPLALENKAVYSVLHVIGDFFILHTRCE